MEYTLIRSKRKTMTLYIRNGILEVRAPLWVPNSEIEKFLVSKEKWIIDKLNKSKAQKLQRGAFTLNYGSALLYRSKEYPLIAKEGNRIGFDSTHFYIPPNLDPKEIKHACVQIYQRLAKNYIPERTITIAKSMELMPSAIKINSAKTRWGSCSTKKSINFSWRLIMADDETIDYVIIHELAHLIEMNHSPRFWQIVENVLPDYRKYLTRLKELQNRLASEDWE